MKTTAPIFALSVILITLIFGGCAPVTPKAGDVIGLLRVSGPNVLLNNAPASDGDTVRLGNSLVTGAGSSARLDFRDGGHLQLDQNTDPIFEWLEQSKCILIRIFRGQAFLSKGHACIEGPNIALALNSEVNVLVQQPPAPSEVTLLKGSAEVTVPVRVKLVPGQQLVTTTERRAPAVRTLSAAELRSVADWRRGYLFRPLPVAQPEGPSIFFPPRTRPSGPREAEPAPKPEPATPKPEPATPTQPSGTSPILERGIRVPPDLIRRDTEPVIR